jgi:hypothetical protein
MYNRFFARTLGTELVAMRSISSGSEVTHSCSSTPIPLLHFLQEDLD